MPKIILLVIFQAVFSFTFLPVSYSDSSLIETTCKHTPFFDLCVSTLRSDPRSVNADVAGLAIIMANSIYVEATATLYQIKEWLKSAKDPSFRKALQRCVDSYNTIIQTDIPTATEAIIKRKPKFAVASATDAAKEAQICENSFANPPKSPISDINKYVHDLSVVLKSIASLLL